MSNPFNPLTPQIWRSEGWEEERFGGVLLVMVVMVLLVVALVVVVVGGRTMDPLRESTWRRWTEKNIKSIKGYN